MDLWSTPHPLLPEGEYPSAGRRRAGTIGLPVHQELRPHDLERIIGVVRGRRAIRPVPRLDLLDSLFSLREEWEALALASRNVFSTREWLSTWCRHFGGGDERLLAAACRGADDQLLAILPLHLWLTRPLRVLRFVGHGPSDELGPVCAPAERALAARALRRLLASRDSPRWNVFLGERLPGDGAWSAKLRARRLLAEPSPVIRLPADWDEFLASRSSHFRKKLGWQERRLGAKHELRYRLADDPERLDADLTTLIDLHRARWVGAEDAFRGRLEAFHREFAALALERGWLRLWFLELDGRPAAAWYGFRFAGVESHYQSGRDPAFSSESLGTALLAHAARAALEDGIREVRLLRGGEPYKYRFATADPGLETVALASSLAGHAGLLALRVRLRQAPSTKRGED